MDEDDLRQIEARVDAAAPGPWTSWIEGRDHTAGSSFIETRSAEGRGDDIELLRGSAADQDFMAAARSDIPALIAEVRRLRNLMGTTGRIGPVADMADPASLPTFHDGYLTGLAVSERAATLSIVRSDGVAWQVELSGVRYLKADDFREGNIIARFDAVAGAEPSRDLIEALVQGPHEKAAQEYHDKYRAHVDTLVEQVASGSLSLVTLIPSYGCEVIVVCEKITGAEVR